MNRIMGLILALSVGSAVGGCASAGTTGGAGSGAAPSKAAAGGGGAKPSENKMTREASRNMGLAMLKANPAEQEALYQQALGEAQAAIEANAENPRGWILAGQAYAKLKEYAAADSAFTRAVTLYPAYETEVDGEREEAWVVAYNDAIAAYQQDDMAGAIRGMESASLIYRKRPEALQILGSFYANQNEIDKSIEAYKGALAIVRTPAPATADEEVLKQWAESEEEIAMNIGMLLSGEGRAAEAVEVYQEFLALHPGHLEAEVNLAVAMTQQGKTAEAAEVFSRLAARTDLTDSHLLMVGIGMFNADNFKAAADAFRSATAKNAYSRDGHLNLAKALLRMSLELEEEHKGANKAAVSAQLGEVYKEMISASEKTRELDPYNREVLTFIMRSQQSLSQMATDAKARSQFQTQVQATLKQYEDIPFEIDNISVQTGSDEVTISGTVTNLKVAQGQPITLRFTMLAANGAVLGAGDVTVAAAAADASAPFRVVVPVSAEMEGWRYERVQ
jgi:tetratricopeptide (TPR) repeat protein